MGSMQIELGIPDVRALPGLAAEPERWAAVHKRMQSRVFMRSEGNVITVGTPQIVSGGLLERSRQVTDQFNRFYHATADAYYTRPDLRAEHLVNSMLEPLLELEASDTITTPLSRLDAVLAPDGGIRVIEINSVGVCLIHMRGLFYMIRELSRNGFEGEARRLDQLASEMVGSFVRYAEARSGVSGKKLLFGGVVPTGFLRAGFKLFAAAFQRHGHDFVFGGPEHMRIEDDGMYVRGRRVDVLWPEFLVYMAYQYSRYIETKFPTRMPDYGKAPEQAAALLSDKRFLDHVRTGRVVNISPARSYLALPKALLSWIHRDDRPVGTADRSFLQQHVARTYSERDRRDGLISLDHVAKNRGDYLVKPCQYGASHGVVLGPTVGADEWRAKLTEVWDDPNHAVQDFHEPIKTATGDWVSYGLGNYDGRLGGVYFRTAKDLLINARDSGFVAAVME
jgi:hypothetical protein